jgi:hypothetical protein
MKRVLWLLIISTLAASLATAVFFVRPSDHLSALRPFVTSVTTHYELARYLPTDEMVDFRVREFKLQSGGLANAFSIVQEAYPKDQGWKRMDEDNASFFFRPDGPATSVEIDDYSRDLQVRETQPLTAYQAWWIRRTKGDGVFENIPDE